MKINEPDYSIERMGTSDYRFVFSTAVNAATEKFDNILESGGGKKGLTSALRLFLNEHPDHMDALYHYAMCKLDEGKSLDAFAFAHAAVAIGRAALPSGFRFENDCLPGGWIENRPFLRSLYGLMSTQRVMGRVAGAIQTARELLGCDSQDRMGARLFIPLLLLQQNRNHEALEVFQNPAFEGTFGPATYLHALALIRLERQPELNKVWEPCFQYYPKVATYLLDPRLPRPENQSPFGGVILGSDYEGWSSAVEQRWIWANTPGALDRLRQACESFNSLRD